MTTKTNNEWEKRFDKKAMTIWDISTIDQKQIKSFIRQLLQTARKKGYEEGMAEWYKTDYPNTKEVKEIRQEAIKDFLKELPREANEDWPFALGFGYLKSDRDKMIFNICLQEIKELGEKFLQARKEK